MQENKINKGRLTTIIRDFINNELLQPGESLQIFRDTDLLWTVVKKGLPIANNPNLPPPPVSL